MPPVRGCQTYTVSVTFPCDAPDGGSHSGSESESESVRWGGVRKTGPVRARLGKFFFSSMYTEARS